MYKTEEEVAKKAEQMLEAALRQKTSSFRNHINRNPEDKSLKDATAKATVKKYGSKKNGNNVAYMRRLSIKMARHGFVQHFGVDTTRSGSTRTRKKPRETTYSFKSHVMNMPAKPFINEAVDNSGVIPFVMENVTRIRAEELLFEVKKILENK